MKVISNKRNTTLWNKTSDWRDVRITPIHNVILEFANQYHIIILAPHSAGRKPEPKSLSYIYKYQNKKDIEIKKTFIW